MEMKSKKRFHTYPASKVHVAGGLFALVWFIANCFWKMYTNTSCCGNVNVTCFDGCLKSHKDVGRTAVIFGFIFPIACLWDKVEVY